MIAALMAAGTWLLTASYFGLPVSTTHSIVGAVVGFGCVAIGPANIDWGNVGFITSGWLISPLVSAAVAFVLFSYVLRSVFYKRNPVLAAKRVTPYLSGMVIVVLIGVTAFKGLKPFWKNIGVDPFEARILVLLGAVALISGLIAVFITRALVHRIEPPKRTDSDSSGSSPLSPDVSRSLSKATKHLRRVRDESAGGISDEAAKTGLRL